MPEKPGEDASSFVRRGRGHGETSSSTLVSGSRPPASSGDAAVREEELRKRLILMGKFKKPDSKRAAPRSLGASSAVPVEDEDDADEVLVDESHRPLRRPSSLPPRGVAAPGKPRAGRSTSMPAVLSGPPRSAFEGTTAGSAKPRLATSSAHAVLAAPVSASSSGGAPVAPLSSESARGAVGSTPSGKASAFLASTEKEALTAAAQPPSGAPASAPIGTSSKAAPFSFIKPKSATTPAASTPSALPVASKPSGFQTSIPEVKPRLAESSKSLDPSPVGSTPSGKASAFLASTEKEALTAAAQPPSGAPASAPIGTSSKAAPFSFIKPKSATTPAASTPSALPVASKPSGFQTSIPEVKPRLAESSKSLDPSPVVPAAPLPSAASSPPSRPTPTSAFAISQLSEPPLSSPAAEPSLPSAPVVLELASLSSPDSCAPRSAPATSAFAVCPVDSRGAEERRTISEPSSAPLAPIAPESSSPFQGISTTSAPSVFSYVSAPDAASSQEASQMAFPSTSVRSEAEEKVMIPTAPSPAPVPFAASTFSFGFAVPPKDSETPSERAETEAPAPPVFGSFSFGLETRSKDASSDLRNSAMSTGTFAFPTSTTTTPT
eukprot:RCo047122